MALAFVGYKRYSERMVLWLFTTGWISEPVKPVQLLESQYILVQVSLTGRNPPGLIAFLRLGKKEHERLFNSSEPSLCHPCLQIKSLKNIRLLIPNQGLKHKTVYWGMENWKCGMDYPRKGRGWLAGTLNRDAPFVFCIVYRIKSQQAASTVKRGTSLEGSLLPPCGRNLHLQPSKFWEWNAGYFWMGFDHTLAKAGRTMKAD